jgi:hypothetical protein
VLLDVLGALEAVAAHAGQYDEQHAVAPALRRVLDGQVGARAKAADGLVLGQVRALVAVQAQVAPARGEQRRARLDRRAVGRLDDVQA